MKLVTRQISKWPGGKFKSGSHVTVSRIREVLGDPTYGFTEAFSPTASNRDDTSSLSSLSPSPTRVENEMFVPSNNVGPPVENPGSTGPVVVDPVSECRNVRILIEDCRNEGHSKSVENIMISPVKPPGFSLVEDVWFVDAHELVCKLQETCSAVSGKYLMNSSNLPSRAHNFQVVSKWVIPTR